MGVGGNKLFASKRKFAKHGQSGMDFSDWLPNMATGASDCMWYRAAGVDCYIASPLFLKSSDYLSHGLDERAPIANIRPGIAYYLSLFTDLSK